MKKLLSILIPFMLLTTSCKDELLYDYEAQLAIDLVIIDQYLTDNNIAHEVDNSNLRYEVLNFAQGDVLGEQQYADFEVTMWFLDGTFYGSTNVEVDLTNGGNGSFSTIARTVLSTSYNYSYVHYFPIIANRMTLGDRYRVYVPSALGFGFETEYAPRPIAPNTNLIVEVELIEIGDFGG